MSSVVPLPASFAILLQRDLGGDPPTMRVVVLQLLVALGAIVGGARPSSSTSSTSSRPRDLVTRGAEASSRA